MSGNSTTTLQNLVDDASSFGDLAPALATGGFSDAPAISMANDVMVAMLAGGPDGAPFNWKFNRFNTPAFSTISFQQDYYIPGLVNLGWLESCWTVNINQQSLLKSKYQVEVARDLQVTFDQTGYPGKICWLQNDFLLTGTWGASPQGPTVANPGGQTAALGLNPSGLQNPGPLVVFTDPLGSLTQPINATTNIKDPNGNLWTITTFGTCGATQPVWPVNPVFPDYLTPNTVATTQVDGSVIWTAINPKGQGFRLSPIPPQTGISWRLQPVGQMRMPRFKSLGQTLEPIPDDYSDYFKQGFFAQAMRRSPDPKVRAKFPSEWAMWLRALDMSMKQGNREKDDFGFYPGSSVMEADFNGFSTPRPDYPFLGW